jgi:hypothetical protein
MQLVRTLSFFDWHALPNNPHVSIFENEGLRLSRDILKSKTRPFLNLAA